VNFRRHVVIAVAVVGSVGAVGAVAWQLGGGPVGAPPVRAARPTSITVETVAPDAPALVVPGGVAVSASPGSPPGCRMLVEAAALRGLATTIGQFTAEWAGGIRSGGLAATKLRSDAVQLRALAGQVDFVEVPDRLRDVADAVEAVTVAGPQDPAATNGLSDALAGLGEAVQGQCHFAIG
jgi:hypothetical protein